MAAGTRPRPQLEAEHAAALQRVPGALFLEQARFALMLRRMLAQEKISHLHATSSRALVGALLVKRLFPITVSAAIEADPALSAQRAEGRAAAGRRRPRFRSATR